MSAKDIIQSLLELQNAYANTYRTMMTGERLKHALLLPEEIDVKAEKNREPLLEHVGHLPVIASYLYRYIEHKKEVDLGRALIMLSIHDIGETITGDILTYKKSDADSVDEYAAAKDLLPDELMTYYDEFENCESVDARFAKCVDSIAPFLHEITTPKLTRKRFLAHGFNSEKIKIKKTVLFEWDNILKQIFAEIMVIYSKIEEDEPTGYLISFDIE